MSLEPHSLSKRPFPRKLRASLSPLKSPKNWDLKFIVCNINLTGYIIGNIGRRWLSLKSFRTDFIKAGPHGMQPPTNQKEAKAKPQAL